MSARMKTMMVYDLDGGETDLIQVSMFRGDDGVPVVQIDADEGGGHVRVNLNDAPIFDQDPESPSRIDYDALHRAQP